MPNTKQQLSDNSLDALEKYLKKSKSYTEEEKQFIIDTLYDKLEKEYK